MKVSLIKGDVKEVGREKGFAAFEVFTRLSGIGYHFMVLCTPQTKALVFGNVISKGLIN